MRLEDQPAFSIFIHTVDSVFFRAATVPHSDIAAIGQAAQQLVSNDDWLPPEATVPHPQFYQQYLLYCDPQERYSVVSFVWGIGQRTPVHDHMTWGVIAMLRGAEHGERYEPGAPMRVTESATLRPGQIEIVSPEHGDIHRVSNACDDQVSISIHIYGGNIGRISRHVFDPQTGVPSTFVSGYANADANTRGYGQFFG